MHTRDAFDARLYSWDPEFYSQRADSSAFIDTQILGSGSHLPTHQKLKGVRIPELHAKFQYVV